MGITYHSWELPIIHGFPLIDLQFPYHYIGSMYGIFTYIWIIYWVNVGKYTSTMDHMGHYIGPISGSRELDLGCPTASSAAPDIPTPFWNLGRSTGESPAGSW